MVYKIKFQGIYESNNHSFRGVFGIGFNKFDLLCPCAGMDKKWNNPDLGLVAKVSFQKIPAD